MPTIRYLVIFNWSKMRLPWKPFEQVHFCKELPPAHIDLGCQLEPGMFSFFGSYPPSKLSTIQNIKTRSRNIVKILNKDIEEAASMTSINFWSVGVSIAACNGRLFLQVCVKYNLCFVSTAKFFVSWDCCLVQLGHKVRKSDLIPNWCNDALPRNSF